MTLLRRTILLVHLLLLLFSFHLSAEENFLITYLGIGQGLSNNSVRAIYQDHSGFLWFGTYDGLNRYDGYEFKIFRNRLNDTTSLPHNYIYSITEDKQYNIWVGTGQGISIYNNLSGKFRPVYLLLHETGKVIKNTSNVNVSKTDNQGNVFLGTNGWGFIVHEKGNSIGRQIPARIRNRLTTSYQIRGMTIDRNQRVWLYINELGLCFYDASQRAIRSVAQRPATVNCMVADDAGNFWLGTNDGLVLYSVRNGKILKTFQEENGKLNANLVTSLALSQEGKLWIGTEGGGLSVLDTRNDQMVHLIPGEQRNALSSESIVAVYIDKEERKWIGTLKGGLNIIDRYKSRFQTYRHDPLDNNSLVNNFAASFYEDEKGQLWIGTDGGGVSVWDRKGAKFTNYRHFAGNASSLSYNLVNSIVCDKNKTIWLATFGGGVNRFDKRQKSFIRYRCVNPLTGTENKNVWRLFTDHFGTLWATTFSSGKLYFFNKEADRFEMFGSEFTDLISLMEDWAGNLWAGDAHQLIWIDRVKKQHRFYEIGKPVRAIYEDTKGGFWLGTEGGGLVLFDRQRGKIDKRYADSDGLSNNAVLSILEDNKGHLWLSTFNGLSQFDSKAGTFQNYYQSDGLQSNQFLYSSALKLRSGELVFGGIEGFTIFHPDSLHHLNKSSVVLLTNFLVNNQPVQIGSRYIEAIEDDQVKSLEIPYDEAVLSFGFTALEYSAPDKISYAYFLEGWDKDWNYSDKARTASYSNLREGTYYLRLRSTDTQGAWNTAETVLKITVLPPWYRTFWAYGFYLLMVASLIYLYLRYKTRQTKLEYEVKLAHHQAEQEKQLHEKKLSFFTDVSHEFRTPLTLIINPLKDYINQSGKTRENSLQVVYRNARRLLSLVDQLLLFQRADADREDLKVSKLNFYDLCHEVYSNFEIGAKTKNIRYEFKADNAEMALYADKEKMEIILYNLLSNAFKYTPEGGSIQMRVAEGENGVEVFVEDTGPGIPEEVGHHLFERFYQVKGTKTSNKPGFGIGLYLVKHFVDKHNGAITFSNRLGGGASFHLHFRKGLEHLQEYSFSKTAVEKTLLPELIQEPEDAVVFLAEKESLPEIISDKSTVLIVEDEKDIREYVATIFQEEYRVFKAKSGTEGLQVAREILPDIIISDVMMENGTGLELCQVIKNDPATNHIPVILLTAVSTPEVKLRGVEGGADDYITKPFEKELLVARVKALVKNRTALQQYFYNEVTLRKTEQKISPEYKAFLERCIEIVESHLEDDDFNIKKLTQEIGMSHSNLYRKVKIISGQSVSAFIRFLRVRKAAELMIKSGMNVNEASFQVGISDVKYFRKQFQKLFGMNPSDYIKKYRSSFSDSFIVNKNAMGPDE